MAKQRSEPHDVDSGEAALIQAAEQTAFGAQEGQVPSSAPRVEKRLMEVRLPGYRLLNEIHSGGQGIVYRALQESTRRDVAIKFLRSGPLSSVDDRERFERETKVLGQLRHPHIIAVHESGQAGGHHYLVMDFVDGVSAEKYVDAGGLTIDETLTMFRTVCEAVHAAHLRGVIHRDLKPSNILVDASGHPYVLDFGLAKLSMELSETMESPHITVTGQFLGTLPWASPEQVDGTADRVDIRTDIYSLGVLLFRLLTGVLPYEVRGRIRDVLANIATAPPTRPRSIRPDLDPDVETIVLKCLSKTPHDRYQSVAALIDDLDRYGANQPILARPPSVAYHLKKLVTRHKTASTLIGSAFACFLAFGVVMTVLYRRAEVARGGEIAQRVAAEENLARALQAESDARTAAASANQVSEFLVELLGTAEPDQSKGGTVTVRDVLDRGAQRVREELADQPILQATLMITMGRAYRSLALYDEAHHLLADALSIRRETLGDRHPDVAASMIELAGSFRDQGDFAKAEAMYRDALDSQEGVLGADSPAVAQTLNDWSVLLCKQGKYAEAEPKSRRALAIRRAQFGDHHPEVAQCLNGLCMIFENLGKYAEAEPMCREALAIRQKALGHDHSTVAVCLDNLAKVLEDEGDYDEAEQRYKEALEINKKLLGDQHPRVGLSIENLGSFYYRRGDYDTAVRMYRDSLAISRKTYGKGHPELAYTLGNLGAALVQQGKLDEAEALDREALAIRRNKLPADSPLLAVTLLGLGKILVDQGESAEAEPLLREALTIRKDALPKGHWLIAVTESILGECLAALDRFEEAEVLLLRGYDELVRSRGEGNAQTTRARQRIVNLYARWKKPERANAWHDTSQAP